MTSKPGPMLADEQGVLITKEDWAMVGGRGGVGLNCKKGKKREQEKGDQG